MQNTLQISSVPVLFCKLNYFEKIILTELVELDLVEIGKGEEI